MILIFEVDRDVWDTAYSRLLGVLIKIIKLFPVIDQFCNLIVLILIDLIPKFR